MTEDMALMSAAALTPTALGLALGTCYLHHVSEARFRKIFLVALVAIDSTCCAGR